MSIRDISEHIKEIYDFEISESTVSNVTNRVLSDIKNWQGRALKENMEYVFWMGCYIK
jgi:transposase-like protein